MPQSLPPTPNELSGGDTPGANPLTLGGVQFNSIECPDELPIGATEQKLVVIELVGGGRIVQPLGIQPKPVSWKGRFWSSLDYIEGRIQQLRSYQVAGSQQSLTYLTESWTCVVKEFTPTWRGGYCDYSITVEIVSGGALTNTSFPTVNSQVDGNNSAITSQLQTLAQQIDATAFEPINVAWQAYLAALGILFASEQIYQ